MKNSRHVICEKRSYSKELKTHLHEFGQFLFPLEGTLDIQIETQKIKLTPDYCFYLPPNFQHLYRSNDRNEFLILDIPYHFLSNETDILYIRLDHYWSSIRFLLLEEAAYSQGSNTALTDLTRYVTCKLPKSTPPSINYIHKHFKEPIQIETLAEIEHYHPVYYSSWFKQKTGTSPKEYISKLRLKEAKHLLGNTTWSITKISEEVGFENSSSFTRWFVKCEGIPPQRYRILHIG